MDLVVVTSSYPRGPDDVAGRFVWEMNRRLADRGWRVRVFAWRGPEAPSRRRTGGHEATFVPWAPRDWETLFFGDGVERNLAEAPLRAAGIPAAMASMARRLHRELRDDPPDLVVGHWLVPSGVLVGTLAEAHDAPWGVVAHSGGVQWTAHVPGWRDLVGRLLEGRPVAATSRRLADELRGFADDAEAEVRPMGFPAPPRAGVDGAEEEDGTFGEWLVFGRLVPIKRPALAIRAYEASGASREGRLHVAGEGELRGELEGLAAECEASVEFHGNVTGRAKRELLNRCDAALFPSRGGGERHEGLPVGLLECAGHGVVPIVGPIPDIGRVIADPERQIVDADDPDSWARRIDGLRALERRCRVRLRRATRRAVEPYQWDELIDGWADWMVDAAGC